MKFCHFTAGIVCSLAILTVALAPGSLWAQGNFVYTNNNPAGSNTVSALSVGTNGSLTPIAGSPFPTGGTGDGGGLFATNRIVVSGNLLFASNGASADVSVFAVDATSGALSLVAGSPFKTGAASGAIALAATPDGKFLMAASYTAKTVFVFSVATNGVLTLASQLAVGTTVDAAKVTPDGKYLALSESLTNSVAMFSIATDGSLTSVGTFAGSGVSGRAMADVDINCASNMLFASEYNSTGTIVDVYSIGSGGTLSPVSGSPFTASGIDSAAILLSPDDKTVFVSNPPVGTLAVASVAANGTLSFLTGSPFPMIQPSFPAGMATSADGKLLYVGNFQNFVSVFSVASGTVTEVAGSPFLTGAAGTGLRSLAAFPPKTCVPPPPPVLTVQMMIKPPAAPPVPINPYAEGKLPVAILSTATFNAFTQVDRTSLTFGHSGSEKSLAFCNDEAWDVNGDGLPDLVCHFNVPQAGFVAGDTTAYLKGKPVSGGALQASEAIIDPGHVHERHHHREHDNDGGHENEHHGNH